MTIKQFYKNFKGANCPKFRGAPQPKFNPSKINESQFADELRFKSYETDFIEGDEHRNDKVHINWESQSWNDEGVDGLVEEIKRCLKHIGFVGNVELEMWERGEKGSGEYEAYREFEVM